MTFPLPERVAAVEADVAELAARAADDRREVLRVRDRVHQLVGALAAVTHLTDAIGEARTELAGLRAEVPAIARLAAEEAIAVALEHRDELNRAHAGESRARAALIWQGVAAVSALAGGTVVVLRLLGVAG